MARSVHRSQRGLRGVQRLCFSHPGENYTFSGVRENKVCSSPVSHAQTSVHALRRSECRNARAGLFLSRVALERRKAAQASLRETTRDSASCLITAALPESGNAFQPEGQPRLRLERM
ncbi:hypothetical protein NDU88_004082 [Pleurodeles waltl]|uniref:Uncharacterized protein n=1 Tax=Pleurodeles waltl TaxID=8319 RepID=A0AAV7VH79_PLEWA|nr:hypothetical protein NDU88_004082 [Pleurodeles waltl]